MKIISDMIHNFCVIGLIVVNIIVTMAVYNMVKDLKASETENLEVSTEQYGTIASDDEIIIDEATNLVAKYEGFRSDAYLCPAGVWTIGYGCTDPAVVKLGHITKDEATNILKKRIREEYASIKMLGLKLNRNQTVALISIRFNIGAGNFNSSTLLKKLKQGDYAGASAEFPKWRLAKGVVLQGLVNRRAEERKIFDSNDL